MELSFLQGTVVGVTSRIFPPLENIEVDTELISVFVDVAYYAKWIQEQCKKFDKKSNCTFNDKLEPKEEATTASVSRDTSNSASHLKSSLITFVANSFFLIGKMTSMN